MARLLILGAGYIGAALGARALEAGDEVVLADNWYATQRVQLDGLAARGADVITLDIRDGEAVDGLLRATTPDRVHLLAAQASRPLSIADPDYTEQTNVTGVRRVAEAVARRGGPPLVFASSLHVYGPGLNGEVAADRPYGVQGDLAHLSKVYGELCLGLYARRHGLAVAFLRLGIVYGPGPVTHERSESQTVVDRFAGLAAAGRPLPLADGGRATIGVVHLDDCARILHEFVPASGVVAHDVAGQTITVADVAALAEGRAPAGGAVYTVRSPFSYAHDVAEYLAR
ncbi:MAG TPA: NAD(P)-dependent oxidoreductase [Solirubrobacteraceae bacterium]|nr:NAD(P)-dependent oxidoreductase [Solirubrobacteraceae bacterium]